MQNIQVGDTPLDRCDYLSKRYGCDIYLKKEFYNPSNSAKDRPALNMINDAVRQHKLKPGSTIVEASSGNTGIGIAYFAQLLGYKAVVFVSQSCSPEKLAELERFGAEIIVCENSNGFTDKSSTQYRAASYAEANENCYYTNQYGNDANYLAHYSTTGPEIWEQSDGQISHFFAGLGTAGTIRGVGSFLKQKNTNVHIVGVEPIGSVLSHYKTHGVEPNFVPVMEKISGIGRTFVPGVFDPRAVDEIYQVGAQRSKQVARDYFRETGLCIGFSSAAVLCGLEDYATQRGIDPADQIVLLFADHGRRYKQLLYPDLTEEEVTSYVNL